MRTKNIRKTFFLIVFSSLLLCFINDSCAVVLDEPTAKTETPQYVPGEILVKFKEGADPSSILKDAGIEAKEINKIHSIKPVVNKFKKDYKIEKDPQGGWYSFLGKQYKEISDIPDEKVFEQAYTKMPNVEKNLYRIYKIKLPREMSVEDAVAKLKDNPDVEFVQPNHKMQLYMAPNDPYYSSSNSWGQGFDDLYGLKKLQCADAWDVSQGEDVVVAVIDTGVDYNHPDLWDNIWVNSAIVPDNNGDGKVDLNDSDLNHNHILEPTEIAAGMFGYDFSDNDNDPSDYYGHGTHVAGTIAAVGNNNTGIIGVAPKTKVMSVKIFPNANDDVCAAGIKYAADNGANILSNSWGPPNRNPSDPAVEAAIDYADSKGCIIVFAAGNSRDDVQYYSPANYPKVITVAAVDSNDRKASFSNYGYGVDVAAPGVDVLSLRASGTDMYSDGSHFVPEGDVNAQYLRANGTSMACPHVAGLSALVASRHPEFTPKEMKYVLRYATDQIISNSYIGTGRINARKAVIIDMPLPIASFDIPETISDKIDIAGEAYGTAFQYYVLEYAKKTSSLKWIEFHRSSTQTRTALISDWDTTQLSDGQYIIRLNVHDTQLRVSTRQIETRIKNLNISMPMTNDVLKYGMTIDIKGTVKSGSCQYALEYGRGNDPITWSTAGITVLNGGHGGIINGVLGRWDTEDLVPNQFYTLRLKAIYSSGFESSIYSRMIYFNSRLRPGWPVYIPRGTSLPINTADDMRKYLESEDYQLVYPADLDNDGIMELITIDNGHGLIGAMPSKLNVYKLDGTLLWSREIGGGHSDHSEAVAADLDGDGYKEIYVAIPVIDSGSILDEVFYGFDYNGNDLPGWPVRNVYYGMARILSAFNAIADLDGDGRDELVITARDATVHDADGLAMRPVFVIRQSIFGPSIIKYYISGEIGTGNSSYSGPTFGNFDDDPALEMVTWCNTNEIGVFDIEGPDGTKLLPKWSLRPPLMWESISSSPTVGDVNNDGYDEIVAAVHEGANGVTKNTLIYIFDRNGYILPGWPVRVGTCLSQVIPALADLDGDRNLEICIPIRPSSMQYVFHCDGSTAQGWPRSYNLGGLGGPNTDALGNIIGDINGDGHPDIILSSGGISQGAIKYGFTRNCMGVIAWNADGTLINLSPGLDSPALIMEGVSYPGFTYRKGVPTLIDLDGNGKLDVVSSSIADFGMPFSAMEEYIDKARNSIYIWELDTPFDTTTMEWPTYKGNFSYTGRYIAKIQNPTNLTATAVSVTKIRLCWKDNSTNETAFVVERRVGVNGPYLSLVTLPANIATYNDTTVKEGTRYCYRVRASNSGRYSVYSNEVNVTTLHTPSTGTVALSNNYPSPNLPIVFTTTYIDGDGYQDILYGQVLVSGSSNGAKIHLSYNLSENKLRLNSADGSTWIGGYAPGSNNQIDNGLFVLNCLNTTVSGSGNTLTIRWAGYFKPTYTGQKYMYLSVIDRQGQGPGWDPKGTITIQNYAPQAGTLTASIPSGSYYPGQEVVFTAIGSDLNGADDIRCIAAIWNTPSEWTAVVYDSIENNLYMLNDTGTAWIGGYTPGSNNIIKNSYMELDCGGTIVSKSGNTVRVNFKLRLYSTMQGTKNLYINVSDRALVYSGWGYKGTYRILSDIIPQTGTVTPSSGTFVTNTPYTFSAVYNDRYWANDIAWAAMNIWQSAPSPWSYRGVLYDSVHNLLYISNDNDTGLIGGVAPGTATTISNSYITLDCAGTTVTRQGSILTVNWKVKFKTPMKGLKYIFSKLQCRGGAMSTWQYRGAIRIN